MVADLVAGVTVGLVALPLAMAFAIASGLTPQAGIYCAIITGFLISALGGSRTQIGGPTGAFVVVIAAFTLASTIQQIASGINTGETAFRYALFNVVSLITTTGFVTVDYTDWGPFSDALFFTVMFLGSCTGSTEIRRACCSSPSTGTRRQSSAAGGMSSMFPTP